MEHPDRIRYAKLMSKVRIRLTVVRAFLDKEVHAVYERASTESMCLQLRKVLELIAFSALVSHREAYTKVRADIAKDWHGKRILKAVEKINPNFYPCPMPRFFNNARVHGGYLTRTQFAKLYGASGELLHSTNPFRRARDFAAFERRIPFWVARIETLLSEHSVSLAGSGERLWVTVPMQEKQPITVRNLVPKLDALPMPSPKLR
jgi:hypothetical protein